MAQYDPLVPTGFVDLDTDYANLQNNFQQLDDIFGIDHVKYSIITNSGFHNKVTTPDQVTAPVTNTDPVLYALQINTSVGLLQFSRGANNAVPTPLTNLNSSVTGFSLATNATVNVLDFTGLSLCIVRCQAVGNFVIINPASSNQILSVSEVYWNGTSMLIKDIILGFQSLHWISSGNILQLKNDVIVAGSMQNVFWTVEIIRIQP